MHLIDTHCHLFLPEFDDDRDEMIQRALSNKVEGFILPNVDSSTTPALTKLCSEYPAMMFPLMGLHPTSVEDDYKNELAQVELLLEQNKYFGIGEIGIDLYWDQSFKDEQEDAFRTQLKWAQLLDLPVVIHIRDSFTETVRIIESVGGNFKGIFHCFTGSLEEANIAIDLGFHLGIGGVLTFKNSQLDQVVSQLDLSKLVVETDSPYLAPAPKRGKRNESAYLAYTVKKLADIFNLHTSQIAERTTSNAQKIFAI
ncbi:MAG: TatD family hydrolase [Bacteroidetes bacterium]|jgi:TatD DNase family protein|nr:TatD family hydrolase [Bacteroidota bacterium]MBT4412243.1 TatD family hydrolase [Bacteroidota bacterium]MBT5425607.1 TatD family hydrolase [Bacteroidota bacterium]MBT7095712.1 TatD family hydrolase [Bacteroidota bacterium]MBT7464512.1 TatD family hydrolase [Bacteroidota bacterium]